MSKHITRPAGKLDTSSPLLKIHTQNSTPDFMALYGDVMADDRGQKWPENGGNGM
jgi:hypothetical protein